MHKAFIVIFNIINPYTTVQHHCNMSKRRQLTCDDPSTRALQDRIDATFYNNFRNSNEASDLDVDVDDDSRIANSWDDQSQSQSHSYQHSEADTSLPTNQPTKEQNNNSGFGHQMQDASFLLRSPKYDPDVIVDFVPGPYRNMDWNAVDEEDKKNTPGIMAVWNECQLCNIDQSAEEREGWDELERIKLAADKNFSEMTPIALAKMMRRMYDKSIKPNIEGELPMRTRMFWLHIDEHAPSVRHMVEDSLRFMTDQLRVLRDEEVFETNNKTGQTRVSRGAASMSLRIGKERKYYIKMAENMRASADASGK